MRPVSAEFPINQPFGSMRTAGVVGDISRPNTVEYYVARYGNYQPDGHAGADFECPEGTPVFAMAAGTVLWADWGTNLPGDDSDWGYRQRWYLYKSFPGIVTVIQHEGWIGVYAHLSAAPLNVGDRVTEGQQIGLSGGTGGVAPHLHAEALVNDNYVTGGGLIYGRTDPEPFFGQSGIAAMGGTTTQSQEDFMGGLIDANQAEDIIKAVVERVVTVLNGNIVINPKQAEDIVQATVSRINATADGKVINVNQADDIAQAAARYAQKKDAPNE